MGLDKWIKTEVSEKKPEKKEEAKSTRKPKTQLVEKRGKKEIAYKIAKRQSFLDCAISQVETRLRG